MTITIEDGTGLPNANSYCSVTDANTYHATNALGADWDAADLGDKEAALVSASRILDERIVWHGMPATFGQGLEWPRVGVADRYGRQITSDALPRGVVRATAELALALLVERDAAQGGQQAGSAVTKVSLGSIEVEMQPAEASATSSTATKLPEGVWNKIADLGSRRSSISRRLIR